MSRGEAKSSTSAGRREAEPAALINSPVHVAPLRRSAKDPPAYGAQHLQDALWEGGNEALPPEWWEHKVPDGRLLYQDDAHVMTSWKRPLPGVRLDSDGWLVPRCEWHISPLGRSYFVNHNTRTTSWKKPTVERPAGSLAPECIIEGHSKCIWSLACLRTNGNIMSTSVDGSIRRWTRDGEPVGEPWESDGGGVGSMAASPDETMVVGGSVDGRLRLWNIKEGNVVGDPWEGHNSPVRCLDWCPNALEIASGSEDGTIRRWNPDTGQQIAPPIEARHGWVYAVKYSPQGDKFASGGENKIICVWSKDGKLFIKITGHENGTTSLCWSKDGAHIFSASFDYTIRKWQSIDGQELFVFRSHTSSIRSISLSPDECYIVSASYDYSVRIWDLETNQLVGDPLLHDDQLFAVVISPDGKYIVSAGLDAKIYVWSLEAALKQGDRNSTDNGDAKPDAKLKGRAAPSRTITFDSRIVSRQQPSNRGLAKYGDDFWGTDTNLTPRRATPPASSSPPTRRSFFSTLHFGTRPANVSESIPLEPRRRNFRLLPVRISKQPINSDVAPCREDDRYGIAPESDVEAAAAMQCTNEDNAGSSTQQGQAAAEVQGSRGRPTQTQSSAGGAEDISYVGVTCCGFFFGCRRPTPH